MESNNNAIITKQDLNWYLIEFCLEGLCLLNIYEDKEFYGLFKQLRKYVNSKIEFGGKGDVIDQYVITEQVPVDEEEYQEWVKNKN